MEVLTLALVILILGNLMYLERIVSKLKNEVKHIKEWIERRE